MKFTKTNNSDELSTITLDNEALTQLVYGLIVAKCSAEHDMETFKDYPEIYASELQNIEKYCDMLKALRNVEF